MKIGLLGLLWVIFGVVSVSCWAKLDFLRESYSPLWVFSGQNAPYCLIFSCFYAEFFGWPQNFELWAKFVNKKCPQFLIACSIWNIHDACIHNAWLCCMCVWCSWNFVTDKAILGVGCMMHAQYIYDPGPWSWCMHVGMMHVSMMRQILSRTNEWTNKAILGVGYCLHAKSWRWKNEMWWLIFITIFIPYWLNDVWISFTKSSTFLIWLYQLSHLTILWPPDSFPEMYFNLRPLLLDVGEDRWLLPSSPKCFTCSHLRPVEVSTCRERVQPSSSEK